MSPINVTRIQLHHKKKMALFIAAINYMYHIAVLLSAVQSLLMIVPRQQSTRVIRHDALFANVALFNAVTYNDYISIPYQAKFWSK